MEKKISQSELLRKIVSNKELSYTVKKSTGSRVVLNAMKTFSVEDRFYKRGVNLQIIWAPIFQNKLA